MPPREPGDTPGRGDRKGTATVGQRRTIIRATTARTG